MQFVERLKLSAADGLLTDKIVGILKQFYQGYKEAVTANGHSIEEYMLILNVFLDLVLKDLKDPYPFEIYHQQQTNPVDYYHFGLDLLRPLIIFEKSHVAHLERVDTMSRQLAEGGNVILLANHQTEPDPQAMSLLLEKKYPAFAQEIIFIAGHRVTTDPLAIPFSMGRNLICIFSKKHIENPPEKKTEKQLHNQKAMKILGQLLAEGGKCIYIAPSGGRDRPNEAGEIEVAPFDPQSIELLWLLAQNSKRNTHFYPLALNTYALLPPPLSVEKELGEQRHAQCAAIQMAFGDEIDMDGFPGSENLSKKEKRDARAEYIWKQVLHEYQQLI